MPTAEEIDVMRRPMDAAAVAMKSKRMLRIVAQLNERGWLEYDPFTSEAKLTQEGRAVLASVDK